MPAGSLLSVTLSVTLVISSVATSSQAAPYSAKQNYSQQNRNSLRTWIGRSSKRSIQTARQVLGESVDAIRSPRGRLGVIAGATAFAAIVSVSIPIVKRLQEDAYLRGVQRDFVSFREAAAAETEAHLAHVIAQPRYTKEDMPLRRLATLTELLDRRVNGKGEESTAELHRRTTELTAQLATDKLEMTQTNSVLQLMRQLRESAKQLREKRPQFAVSYAEYVALSTNSRVKPGVETTELRKLQTTLDDECDRLDQAAHQLQVALSSMLHFRLDRVASPRDEQLHDVTFEHLLEAVDGFATSEDTSYKHVDGQYIYPAESADALENRITTMEMTIDEIQNHLDGDDLIDAAERSKLETRMQQISAVAQAARFKLATFDRVTNERNAARKAKEDKDRHEREQTAADEKRFENQLRSLLQPNQ